MLTIHRTRGVAGPPELVAPIRRAELGGYEPAAPEFADRPAVTCEVWPGGGLPVAAALPVAWTEPAAEGDPDPGVLEVQFPEAAMSALSTGRYQARVRLVDDGREVARFGLVMAPGAGDAGPRPAYHSYDDLLAEWPMVEKFASKANDQTGFAAQAAKARDWIDVEIQRAALDDAHCRRWTASAYADAIAADHLRLDTPEGRQIVEASVYKTLAIILRRAEIVALKSENIAARQDYYEAMARDTLSRVTASFAESTGLPPVRFGRMRVGRVTR